MEDKARFHWGSGDYITRKLDRPLSSLVGMCKEIYLITVGLTEANVATVLAGWLSK